MAAEPLFWFSVLCLCRGDRYDALRACIGDTLCQKLHDLNVFLVSMTDFCKCSVDTANVYCPQNSESSPGGCSSRINGPKL